MSADKDVNRQEELFYGALSALSVVFILILWLYSLPPVWLFTLYVADIMICIVFIWDYSRRLMAAPQKGRFLKYHGYELLSAVPVVVFYPVISLSGIALIFRTIRLIRVIQIMGVTSRFSQLTSQLIRKFRIF
jgi:hypothetical protein